MARSKAKQIFNIGNDVHVTEYGLFPFNSVGVVETVVDDGKYYLVKWTKIPRGFDVAPYSVVPGEYLDSYVKVDYQDALRRISEKVTAATNALREAEAISEETGVSFSFNPEYGMGGTYTPREKHPDDNNRWDDSESQSGWQSSSNNC